MCFDNGQWNLAVLQKWCGAQGVRTLQQLHLLLNYRPFTSANGTSTAQLVSANFGQKPFKFTPPDGFQPMTSSILRPDTVIARSDQYVQPKVVHRKRHKFSQPYDAFSQIFLWVKKRSATKSHQLVDTVRGLIPLEEEPNIYPQTQFTGGGRFYWWKWSYFNATGVSLVDNANGDWNLNGNVDVVLAANAKMNDGGLNNEI